MGKRFFFLGFFIFLFQLSFAQKSLVSASWNHLKYDELDKAKKKIDDASLHSQTKGMAKTWYYRGLIYQAIFNHKVFGSLDSAPLEKSFDSYKKALEIEPKGEFSEDILNRIRTVAFYSGVEDYKKKNYEKASSSFEYIAAKNPGDTLALLYAAYSADYGGMSEKAIGYYKRLIEMNHTELEPEKSNIYLELANLYKNSRKDTTEALATISRGRKKYPDAGNLIREEANLFLMKGQFSEAKERLELEIRKNQGDSNLHLVLGGIYEGLANPKTNGSKPGGKVSNYQELMGMAEEHYRKAIDIRSDYFEAYYNLGAMYFNQGADMMNEANALKSDSDYKAAKAKAEEKLRQSVPYLEKALEMQPNDKNTLISLKQIYIRTGDSENYNKIKSALDKLN